MCARSARLLFSFFLSCLFAGLVAPFAEARSFNFATGSPFGLGFKVGVAKAPSSDFATDPHTPDRSYGHFFGFEPFFDFTTFVIRLTTRLDSHPLVRANGTEQSLTYTETSDAGSFSYGLQLLLVPWIEKSAQSRFYLVLGAANNVTSLKNIRIYRSGETVTNTYTERARGTGLELVGGMGFEFFLIQNYSLQFETGYRSLDVNEFGYVTEGDVTGTRRAEGATVLHPLTGRAKKFHQTGPYVSAGFSLNF